MFCVTVGDPLIAKQHHWKAMKQKKIISLAPVDQAKMKAPAPALKPDFYHKN